MKTIYIIFCITILSVLTGCGSGSSSTPASFNQQPAPIVNQPAASPSPTASPSPSPIQLTYYSLARTNNLQINSTLVGPVTTHAMAVQYNSNTYVWDDGPQGYSNVMVNGVNEGSFQESYWDVGLVSFNGTLTIMSCGWQCQQDVFTQPTLTDTNALNWFSQFNSTSGQTNVNAIFSSGIPTIVNCTLSENTLSCVNFSIDLAQTPL
jgi:hypothetical protein